MCTQLFFATYKKLNFECSAAIFYKYKPKTSWKWTAAVPALPRPSFSPHCGIQNCLRISGIIPPLISLCGSGGGGGSSVFSPNEEAPRCLTLWTPPARLHLRLTNVLLFSLLLKLSLADTPTGVTANAVQVRSPPFTCCAFLTSATASLSWHTMHRRVHVICIQIQTRFAESLRTHTLLLLHKFHSGDQCIAGNSG